MNNHNHSSYLLIHQSTMALSRSVQWTMRLKMCCTASPPPVIANIVPAVVASMGVKSNAFAVREVEKNRNVDAIAFKVKKMIKGTFWWKDSLKG